jgi:hypothetical protein
MRARFVIVVIGIWMSLGLLPLAVVAAPMDGSAPMLCALNAVMECSRRGDCERTTAEDAGLPPFVRVNVQQRLLSSVDGARTSPITAVQRSNGRLMLQGMQNERVWGAVIDEETGRMSATVGENDGAFVISGACIAP